MEDTATLSPDLSITSQFSRTGEQVAGLDFLIPSTATGAKGFSVAIRELIDSNDNSVAMGNYNKTKIKQFDIDVVRKEILEIYQEVL